MIDHACASLVGLAGCYDLLPNSISSFDLWKAFRVCYLKSDDVQKIKKVRTPHVATDVVNLCSYQ